MLNKLKEYKELIAIIVFFLGGFFWLHNQFPTKKYLTEEIGSLNCLLENYMSVTQLQIRNQELEKQASDLVVTITGMESNSGSVSLSPAMKYELDQKKTNINHNRNEYRDNNSSIQKIMDELARNTCRRVTS